MVSCGLIIGAAWLFNLDKKPQPAAVSPPPPPAETTTPAPVQMSKPRLKSLIRNIDLLNSKNTRFFVDTANESYTVHTSLDPRLQEKMAAVLDHLKTLERGKPQRIAMVAIDGDSGLVRAMAGFDLDDPDANPCTAADYPAASIFKIVTAAAAVDTLGYSDHTPLYFNGQKYTLYKRQLKETRNKYTTRVSLAQAFADSINPVFGKLGKNDLGRQKLNHYAHAFGFNQGPETDFEFIPSRFSVTESDYHLAELGCGFNRQTRISPVFGAAMVSTVLNQGNLLVPRVVDRVTLSDGSLVYKSKTEIFKHPIRPETARTMEKIMQKTISSGTAKKAFRRHQRDKVLSTLVIGGKTGSLYNNERTVKYDWFVGYGREKKGTKSLIVSVVVGHRKYIGTRAGTHARTLLRTYFQPANTQNTQ